MSIPVRLLPSMLLTYNNKGQPRQSMRIAVDRLDGVESPSPIFLMITGTNYTQFMHEADFLRFTVLSGGDQTVPDDFFDLTYQEQHGLILQIVDQIEDVHNDWPFSMQSTSPRLRLMAMAETMPEELVAELIAELSNGAREGFRKHKAAKDSTVPPLSA